MQLTSERIFGLSLAWPCSQVQKLSMIYLYSICGDTHTHTHTHRARGNERKAISAWKKHTISQHKPVYAAFQSFVILTHFLIILYVLLIHCMIYFFSSSLHQEIVDLVCFWFAFWFQWKRALICFYLSLLIWHSTFGIEYWL